MASILVGNGINRLSDRVISWEDLLNNLIESINKRGIIGLEEKPYLHVYEEIFSRGSDYANKSESELKISIANALDDFIGNEFHEIIINNLDFDHILTTNYDYNFTPDSQIKNNEKEYSLFRTQSTNTKKKIWHIHGEVNSPNSIMLGYDHYMRSVGRIQKYIKDLEKQESFRSSKSWVDIFLTDTIYILGLGLDFGEIDLWWLLSYRNRRRVENSTLCNKIIYINIEKEDSIDNKEKAKFSMFEAFHVEVKNIKFNTSYKQTYHDIMSYLALELNGNFNKLLRK